MRSVALLASVLSIQGVMGFVPNTAPRFSTGTARVARGNDVSMQIAAAEELKAGITAPLGYFDPLGISNGRDLKKLRESELKHGRVAMLGVLGFLVQESFHPLFGAGARSLGPAINHFQEIQETAPYFWTLLVFGVALAEGKTIAVGWQDPASVKPGAIAGLRENYITGDLGFDPLGLKDKGVATFNDWRSKELNNGRLAMIALLGIIVQELATGKTILG